MLPVRRVLAIVFNLTNRKFFLSKFTKFTFLTFFVPLCKLFSVLINFRVEHLLLNYHFFSLLDHFVNFLPNFRVVMQEIMARPIVAVSIEPCWSTRLFLFIFCISKFIVQNWDVSCLLSPTCYLNLRWEYLSLRWANTDSQMHSNVFIFIQFRNSVSFLWLCVSCTTAERVFIQLSCLLVRLLRRVLHRLRDLIARRLDRVQLELGRTVFVSCVFEVRAIMVERL